ncbi:hypothetical protein C5Y96_06930 [Blastopirellula marina]|uniref:Uncharacterized protein n=1 Tax=Blastopirellula marina TaxID=124 RepID=A0A2S8FXV2_9BACT|nr:MULTISPECIES: hypothetical protein [Pirellulaceae]PQO36890.1 hypothetical protein C5Y96_06930 [Blastopirellula marina]RCS53605.1 hypothetical protein DTL36_06940 [Bremerella cremea]
MDDRELLQQQMLELIYGLLSDEESAELVDRISSDGQLAREYAELKEQTELLGEVAKASKQPPNYDQWKREAEDDRPSPRTPAATWASRTLQVVAALAACLLIAALGYPMLSIDQQDQTLALAKQKENLASNFLSVSVTGPSLMAAEVRNDFFVSIENADAQPVDAEVEYTFKNPEGATVYYGLTKAINGQVTCQIPADEVSYAAKLEVVARHEQAKSQLDVDVKAAPPKPIAVLQTDREIAAPGETVNFRAVVLDPQTNRDQPANVDFVYSLPNQSGLNRIASAETSTLQGVAQGQLQVPASKDFDNVELGVQSPQLQNFFQQRALPVIDAQSSDSEDLVRISASNYGRGFANDAVDAYSDIAPSQIAAMPEGGKLVAGVSNRVRYLATRDQDTKRRAQLQVRGAEARQVAETDKPDQDYGYFEFVPQPMQDYTVEVVEENQAPREEQIAQAQTLPAALQVNNGVALSNQPLEVEVRVAQPNSTLALVANDGYNTIGHNLWEVGVNAPITQPVQLDLPAEASGAQRVQLFSVPSPDEENAGAQPQLIAERIIYRIPVQRYDIDVDGLPDQADPGQSLNLHVSVKDEYASPAQATLGVQMERMSDLLPQSQQPIGLEGEWFFNRRVQVPAGAAPLPENIRDLEKDSGWLDQVLALSTWKEDPPATDPETPEMIAQASKEAEALSSVSPDKLPVMRRSNKKVIQSQYQQALAAIHADWESQLEGIRQTSSWMLTVAGGILVVCLIGLAVVQGLPKIRVWGPGILVALGAVLWGIFSFNLSLPEMTAPTAGRPEMVALNEPKNMDSSRAVNAPKELAEKPATSWMAENVATPMAEESAADTSLPGGMAESSGQLLPAVEMQRGSQPSPQKVHVELRSGPARFAQPMPGAGGMGGSISAPGIGTMSNPAGGMGRGDFGGGARSIQTEPDAMPLPAAPASASANEPQPEASNAKSAERLMARSNDGLNKAEQLLPEPILWQPRLTTNLAGQVNIPVQLPQQPGRYRLLIDAHGSGRLGTVVRYVEVRPSNLIAPVPAPTKKAAN